MIDKVDHIQVTVGAGEEREGKIETDVTPIPVDAGGARVEHVELGQKRIHVSAVIMKKKTVDLKVETTGTPPDGFQLDTVEVAKQITIKGPKNVLENINEISADSIDISRLTETTTVPLHIVPPAGIEISAESKDLQAVVNIKSTGISNLSFQSGDLKVDNLGEGLEVSITEGEVTAIVTKKEGETAIFGQKDIEPYIDLKDLGEGSHKVKIQAVALQGVEKVVFSPEEIEVRVSEV